MSVVKSSKTIQKVLYDTQTLPRIGATEVLTRGPIYMPASVLTVLSTLIQERSGLPEIQ